MEKFYSKSIRETLEIFNTDENGLTSRNAGKRLEKFGYNELQKEKVNLALKVFVEQFKNALILLLIAAASISVFLGKYLDSAAMFGIAGISVILGFVQEYRAEKSIEALKKTSAPHARVIRNGRQIKILARELVPGDIILLESGDVVPADARLIEQSNLQVDESSLTGESVPSKKHLEVCKECTSAAEQDNMVFSATIVTYGKAKAVVTATGMKSEIGQIAGYIQTAPEMQTPLQKKFRKLARQISAAVIVLIIIIFFGGIIGHQGSVADMLLFSLSLTVAAVPNALPVIVTIGLSRGAMTLSKKNMLIKKLPAAESLGSVTIICSDKTGTLTRNEMTITKLYASESICDITGVGYGPIGEFICNGKPIDPHKHELLLRIGMLCNNAKLSELNGRYSIIGDPTEGALITLGIKGGISEKFLKSNYLFVEELPFDSDRKMMSSIFLNKSNHKHEVYVKGAPDILIKKCSKILINGKIRKITAKDIMHVLRHNSNFARQALRVLGFAYREVGEHEKFNTSTIEKNLIFVGLAGMIDPPRPEIPVSLQQCKHAGISVMMITGDHPLTAESIGRQIGMFKPGDTVFTGDQIELLSDEELVKKIKNIRIIARALPIQKLRIVKALQKNGHIVAMTGDGVNDAPALKEADIGIAMGITGTDVAKEVSESILLDDNFASIVNSVKEGRNIYDKMIKSVRYLLSCNSGEIVSVFMAIMLKFPLPMIPLQMLLMNLLTDAVPAVGLGFEEADPDVMKRPPRDPKSNPLSATMLALIVIFGIIMGIGTLYMFSLYSDTDIVKARTVAFTTLVIFEMFAVFSSRSLLPSLKKLNPLLNPWLIGAITFSVLVQIAVVYFPPLQVIFGTTALLAEEWAMIILVSFMGFVMMEAGKFTLKIKTFRGVKYDN